MDTMRRTLQWYGHAYWTREWESLDGERLVEITAIVRFNAKYGNYGVWVKTYNEFAEVAKTTTYHCKNFGQVEAAIGHIAKLTNWTAVEPEVEPKRWRF